MVTRFARKTGIVAAAVVIAVSGIALASVSRTDDSEPIAVRPVTEAEKALLYRAEERLIYRCMAEHGFEYDEIPLDTDDPDREFPYVIDDVAWAKRHGFGDATSKEAPPEASPNEVNLERLSQEQQQEWQATLFGDGPRVSVRLPGGGRLSTNTDGCLAEARRALYGDLERWFRARRLIDNQSVFVRRGVREDSRYEAAIADWAGCMRRKGYQVADPGQLRELAFQRSRNLKAAAARTIEVRAAVTEAMCATSTSLPGVVLTLEREHGREVETAVRREHAELNTLERAALPLADKVLASPHTSSGPSPDESASR
ncbi:hypothetical protein [Nocardioides speluncae]|uniref:hypothetical protein n=1 Tax=Nocardioides speluncae TaxID=2670337 RepID=UPI000D699E4B|nr:hypothetical protein [Nocardioides speluncae]